MMSTKTTKHWEGHALRYYHKENTSTTTLTRSGDSSDTQNNSIGRWKSHYSRNSGKERGNGQVTKGRKKLLNRKPARFGHRKSNGFPSRNSGRRIKINAHRQSGQLRLWTPNRFGSRNSGREKDWSFRLNIKRHPIQENLSVLNS